MIRQQVRHWLCPRPLWRRRRALQAPALPGLLAARACGAGSGLADRRRMAGVKASERRTDETHGAKSVERVA